MDKDRLFQLFRGSPQQTVKDDIGMILSNHITHGSGDGALIHIRECDSIADNLIEYERLGFFQKNKSPIPDYSTLILKAHVLERLEEIENSLHDLDNGFVSVLSIFDKIDQLKKELQ